MGKGKELEFPEGQGGCQGSEVAKRPQPYCAKRNGAATQSGGSPYKLFHCFKKEKLTTTKETQTDWKVYEDNANFNPLLSTQEKKTSFRRQLVNLKHFYFH